ncbi:hypothetical protein C8J57DRAFT_1730503 [Mycena rebaudengoi]|nr:hypothetical protein C8J57DRAFT_1730503 [Mycena rebaudengoi]
MGLPRVATSSARAKEAATIAASESKEADQEAPPVEKKLHVDGEQCVLWAEGNNKSTHTHPGLNAHSKPLCYDPQCLLHSTALPCCPVTLPRFPPHLLPRHRITVSQYFTTPSRPATTNPLLTFTPDGIRRNNIRTTYSTCRHNRPNHYRPPSRRHLPVISTPPTLLTSYFRATYSICASPASTQHFCVRLFYNFFPATSSIDDPWHPPPPLPSVHHDTWYHLYMFLSVFFNHPCSKFSTGPPCSANQDPSLRDIVSQSSDSVGSGLRPLPIHSMTSPVHFFPPPFWPVSALLIGPNSVPTHRHPWTPPMTSRLDNLARQPFPFRYLRPTLPQFISDWSHLFSDESPHFPSTLPYLAYDLYCLQNHLLATISPPGA